MASIHNYQRRALEALMKDRLPQTIMASGLYFLDCEPIFLLGVSDGVGTCSDLHDVDIAVFSGRPAYGEALRGHIRQWAAAAILRMATQEEEQEQLNPGAAYMVVEELAVVREGDGRIEFQRTGRKSVYVNTIC